MFSNPFTSSLSSLPLINGGRSRAITMENPKGEKGQGGKTVGPLGAGRKGSAALRGIPSGQQCTIMDVDGPGIIQHVWFTLTDLPDDGYFTLSDVVLRMYWDGEETPSVEVPIGDFFLTVFPLMPKSIQCRLLSIR